MNDEYESVESVEREEEEEGGIGNYFPLDVDNELIVKDY